jgi:hypothetical protein
LKDHIGHRVEIAQYGNGDNFALEDLDTDEVIFDTDLYELTAKENNIKYIYDIFCPDDTFAGDSGDLIFDTKEEALADAHDYILSYLADEYNLKPSDFNIEIYEGRE